MHARNRRTVGVAAMGALALTLAACGSGDTADAAGTTAGDGLSGSLAGSGASSQEAAVQGWIAGFTERHPDVTLTYDPTGSGTGREQFLNGTVQFAGTDAPLDAEELELAAERCYGGEAVELPLYISPIAVVYHLPSVDAEHLNLSPATIAGIFAGDITSWDDPAIAEANPGVDLPEVRIIPVNRSDDSGTTENFTEYLAAAAPEAWPHGAVETWPISGTQSGAQTSGVIDVVSGAEGTIGYVDASRAGGLGTVAVGVGDEFVPFSPEAAAAVVDVSPAADDATDLRLTIDLARDTTEAGTYPIVLVSYSIACSQYETAEEAALVAEYLTYVASEEGQERASSPDVAGSAPISPDLRERVTAALGQIAAAG